MSKYIELFEGLFDESIIEKMKPENYPYVAYSVAEDRVVYTVIPQIDGVFYDFTELVKKSIPVPSEGYREVDLGLSVKWADRNVGAENPWDNGAYFSWGNVEGIVSDGITKISEDYVIDQAIIIALGGEATPEQIEEIKNNPGAMSLINEMIKTITGLISEYSFDENTYATTSGGQYTGRTLDAEHDAATVNMGDGWRIPTRDETRELVENTNHYYIGENGNIVAGPFEHTTNYSDKGLDGSKLRSICFVKKGEEFNYSNRTNFIEFPFAGRCNDSLLNGEGLYGYVWSSSINIGQLAFCLKFDHNGLLDATNSVTSHYRYLGLSVRGVQA